MYGARPLHIQIAAVDRDNADDIRRTIREQLWHNPWWKERIDVQNYKVLGCGIKDAPIETEIVATDVAGSHGARPDALILNELHAVPSGRWDFVRNCLDNASKMDGRGLTLIVTNAPVRDSECHTLRQMAVESPRWFTSIYSRPAPQIGAAELAEAEKRNPQYRFRRLFWGEVTDASGDACRPGDIAACFTGVPMLNHTPDDSMAILGLDGAVTQHFAAAAVVAKNPAGRYRLLKCWVWRPPHRGKIDLQEIESTIARAHRDYRLHRLVCDPAKVEYMCQRLRRAKVPLEERTQSGRHLVEQCYSLIDNINSHNIEFPDVPQLEYDLKNLRVEDRSYGMRLVSDDGDNGHGDLASAVSICLGAFREMEYVPRKQKWGGPVRGYPRRPDDTFTPEESIRLRDLWNPQPPTWLGNC
jgi:phage terminase large subunit-like protein